MSAELQQMTRSHELDMLLEKSSGLIFFYTYIFFIFKKWFQDCHIQIKLWYIYMGENLPSTAYLSTNTVYQYKKKKNPLFGGDTAI